MIEIRDETSVLIRSETDIVAARQEGRRLATQLSFSVTDQAAIVTAISELARNIVLYAGTGEIVVRAVQQAARRGLVIIARDQGPGISDLSLVMQDGYSTSGGLGMGLPGTRRLMDEFEIESAPGKGTVITLKKWKR